MSQIFLARPMDESFTNIVKLSHQDKVDEKIWTLFPSKNDNEILGINRLCNAIAVHHLCCFRHKAAS